MKIIRSNYRDKDQFEMYVIGEDNENYYVQFTEEFRSQFKDGDSIHTLKKSLVGDKNNLYSIVYYEYRQLDLFEELNNL